MVNRLSYTQWQWPIVACSFPVPHPPLNKNKTTLVFMLKLIVLCIHTHSLDVIRQSPIGAMQVGQDHHLMNVGMMTTRQRRGMMKQNT
jgi:hypothetical protein